MKRFDKRYGLFLILVFSLSGCFQQAGESFQPVTSPIPPTEFIPQSESTAEVNITELTSFPATATLPELDMTIISPTRVLPTTATPEPIEGQGEQPTGEIPGNVTPSPAFITPSSPLGQVTLETPVPGTSSGLETATPSGLITPTSFLTTDTTSGGDCTYTVQRGDTLFRIATNNNTTVAEVTAANPGIDPNLIQPGQVLTLPGCGASVPDNTTSSTDNTSPPPAGDGTSYTVQRGDTLYSIALRYGVTIQEIVDANNLTNPNSLSPGQDLIIPPPANP